MIKKCLLCHLSSGKAAVLLPPGQPVAGAIVLGQTPRTTRSRDGRRPEEAIPPHTDSVETAACPRLQQPALAATPAGQGQEGEQPKAGLVKPLPRLPQSPLPTSPRCALTMHRITQKLTNKGQKKREIPRRAIQILNHNNCNNLLSPPDRLRRTQECQSLCHVEP